MMLVFPMAGGPRNTIAFLVMFLPLKGLFLVCPALKITPHAAGHGSRVTLCPCARSVILVTFSGAISSGIRAPYQAISAVGLSRRVATVWSGHGPFALSIYSEPQGWPSPLTIHMLSSAR